METLVPAAQLISSSDNNVRAAHWADDHWNAEWADNPTRLRIFISLTGTHTPTRPYQEEPGSDLTASAPVSGVSAPVCTNGVWLPLRPVSVAQKNKPSTMLSSIVQFIDLLMDSTAWRFWTMRNPKGCSTPAPRSSAASSGWLEQLAQKKMKNHRFLSPLLSSSRFYIIFVSRNNVCILGICSCIRSNNGNNLAQCSIQTH